MIRIIFLTIINIVTLTSSFFVGAQCNVTASTISLNGNLLTETEVDICISDVNTLSGSEPTTGESGQWLTASGGDVLLGVTTTNPNHGLLSINNSGTSEIIWRITSDNGCDPEERTLVVNVHDTPVADIVSVSSDDVCEDDIDITIETGLLGSSDVASWSSSSAVPVFTSTSITDKWELDVSNLDEGLNSITYTVSNLGCGTSSDVQSINVNQLISPSFAIEQSQTQCIGANLDVNLIFPSGLGTSPVYTWQYGVEPPVQTSTPFITLENLQAPGGDLMVTVSSSEACVTGYSTVYTSVTVVPGPDPELVFSGDSSICEGSSLTLYGVDNATYFLGDKVTYQWFLNNDTIEGATSLDSLEVFERGTYSIIINNGICSPTLSNSLTLDSKYCSELSIIDQSSNGSFLANQGLSISARSTFYVPEIENDDLELKLELYNENGSFETRLLLSKNNKLRASDLDKGLYVYYLMNPNTGEKLRTGAIQVVD